MKLLLGVAWASQGMCWCPLLLKRYGGKKKDLKFQNLQVDIWLSKFTLDQHKTFVGMKCTSLRWRPVNSSWSVPVTQIWFLHRLPSRTASRDLRLLTSRRSHGRIISCSLTRTCNNLSPACFPTAEETRSPRSGYVPPSPTIVLRQSSDPPPLQKTPPPSWVVCYGHPLTVQLDHSRGIKNQKDLR